MKKHPNLIISHQLHLLQMFLVFLLYCHGYHVYILYLGSFQVFALLPLVLLHLYLFQLAVLFHLVFWLSLYCVLLLRSVPSMYIPSHFIFSPSRHSSNITGLCLNSNLFSLICLVKTLQLEDKICSNCNEFFKYIFCIKF